MKVFEPAFNNNNKDHKGNSGSLLAQIGVVAGILLTAGIATAQTPDPPQTGGYQVGESTKSDETVKTASPASTVRLARFEYVSGNVTWRPDSHSDWKPAHQNVAINSGAQIWAVGDGRAEIRFEDGGVVRFGHGAVATLETMYSDSQGAFTRIQMSAGLGMLSLKNDRSVYQAELPTATVIASGASRVRIGVDSVSEVAVRSGKAVVQAKLDKPQKLTLNAGNFASISGADTAVSVRRLPPFDSWDRWNDERDHVPTPGYPRSYSGGSVLVPLVIFGEPHWHRHW